MKTRKTTFVALMSQTLTSTSTFVSRSRSYSASASEGDCREANPATPLAGAGPRWCGECETPIALIAPELAATLCFHTTRAIYRLVEAGRVHFIDGPDGVMVCPASLMKDWAAEHSVPLLISGPVTHLGPEFGADDRVELQTRG